MAHSFLQKTAEPQFKAIGSTSTYVQSFTRTDLLSSHHHQVGHIFVLISQTSTHSSCFLENSMTMMPEELTTTEGLAAQRISLLSTQ